MHIMDTFSWEGEKAEPFQWDTGEVKISALSIAKKVVIFSGFSEWEKTKNAAEATEDAELEVIFKGLSKVWKDSTSGLSITSRRFSHPIYKAIIRLGPEVVPLILKDMQQKPDWWFEALEFLTKTNPTTPTDSFEEAAKAWIEWGKNNNLIS